MTKILLIEDEIPSRKKLRRFIDELDSPTVIMAELDTVQSAVDFLKNQQPDLIISDIELLDGNAFEIYQQVGVLCPIIFTTAYDRFWMDAFDSNGIDYLLKPFSQSRFQKAWDKYCLLRNSASNEQNSMAKLINLVQQNFIEKKYKKRFTINTHQTIHFLEVENILFLEANEGIVFAYDNKVKKHLLTETSLKEIEEQLDPSEFFRINRSQLIHKVYIEKVERYDKNTVSVKLKNFDTYLKTSQSTTASFMEWVKQ